MRDLPLKLLSIIGFVLTLGVLAWYVPDVDLIIVVAIVSGMAIFDFFVRPLLRRRKPPA
jgi:hypothetical protein